MAILSVGAIAVTPVAPNTLDLQRVETHVYDLTATMDATAPPGVVYQALADNTLTNLDLLGAALTTNSAPLLRQVLQNQRGYAGQFGAALQAIPTSLQAWYDGPNGQARLEQAQAALEAGDIGEAYRWFNHSMLYAFSGAFRPLTAPGFILSGTPRGSTEYLAGIPERVSQNFTNLVAATFTSNVLVSGLFQGTFAPISGSVFELSRIVEALSTSMASGDVEGAVNALVNTPGILMNAVLNGFDYADDDPTTPEVEGYTEWPGLIRYAVPGPPGSPRVVAGLLQNLLVTFPTNFANAIDNTPATAPTVVPAAAAVTVAPAPAPAAAVTVAPAVAAEAVAPTAAVAQSTVESSKSVTLTVESLRDETPTINAEPVAVGEAPAGSTTTPPADDAVDNGDAADDTSKSTSKSTSTSKVKITDRIKDKINEVREAGQARVKEVKTKETKATDPDKSNESNGNSGSASE